MCFIQFGGKVLSGRQPVALLKIPGAPSRQLPPLHPPSACMRGCDNYTHPPRTTSHMSVTETVALELRSVTGTTSAHFPPSAPTQLINLPRGEERKDLEKVTFLARQSDGQHRNAAVGIFHVAYWHRGTDRRDYTATMEDVSLHR